MSIQVNDTLPDLVLAEFQAADSDGCSIGPVPFDVRRQAAGKTIGLFAVPGAFTRTCSSKHVPGYLELQPRLKAAGVDELWCLSVNDAQVMGAWARELQAQGIIRFVADGSALFTKAVGLDQDLTDRGMGVRSRRYSAVVRDGVVVILNVEEAGQFNVSDAGTMLEQLEQGS